MQVENLEKRDNNGSISDQLALKEARASLNWILDRELEEKALFITELWVEKVDCPLPKMFAMLKVKHSAEYIPLMKDEIGGRVSSKEENLGFIAAHFQNLFNDKGLDKEEQERVINLVEKCKRKSVSPIILNG